ncbi:unnamed protein product [Penicillium pancosmium]
MERRLSDAIFDGMCGDCIDAAREGIVRAREGEHGQARGVYEAIYDGLCATCIEVCSLAFCRFAQHEIAAHTGLTGVQEAGEQEQLEAPTQTQRRAAQTARITAFLHPAPNTPPPAPGSTPLASIPEEQEGEEELSTSSHGWENPGPTPRTPDNPPSSLGPSPFASLTNIGPPLMWQQFPGFTFGAEASSEPQPGAVRITSVEDPWYPTTEYPLPYGKLQAEGQLRRQWIEDPEAPDCPIKPSPLTNQEVVANNPYILPPVLHPMDEDFADPWLALYTRNFEMDTLRYVFVQHVINEETAPFVKRALYTENTRPGLAWPKREPEIWDHNTPEYDGILGSRIGKVIAYLVLGAFPRGTRRITRIATWAANPQSYDNRLQIRFDIEPVPAA